MSTDTLTIPELERPGSLGDPSPSLPAPPSPESRPDQPDSDAACPLSTLDNKDGADTGTPYCSKCVMELATILPCDLTSWRRWEHLVASRPPNGDRLQRRPLVPILKFDT